MTDPAAAPAVDKEQAQQIIDASYVLKHVFSPPGRISLNTLRDNIAAALADARRAERASLADWFQETFCPRSGVPGDETHARGDCDYCNMAAAIRRPGGAPDEEASHG